MPDDIDDNRPLTVEDPLIGRWMMRTIKHMPTALNNVPGWRRVIVDNVVVRDVLLLCAKAADRPADRRLLLHILAMDEAQMLAAAAAVPHYGAFTSPDDLRAAMLRELPKRLRRQLIDLAPTTH